MRDKGQCAPVDFVRGADRQAFDEFDEGRRLEGGEGLATESDERIYVDIGAGLALRTSNVLTVSSRQELAAPTTQASCTAEWPRRISSTSPSFTLKPLALIMRFRRSTEPGPAEDVFNHPRDAYTRQLIEAIPTFGQSVGC